MGRQAPADVPPGHNRRLQEASTWPSLKLAFLQPNMLLEFRNVAQAGACIAFLATTKAQLNAVSPDLLCV